MAETLSLVSTISYIASGVFLVAAVFFFFFFRIPAVIGDLTGATARLALARRRAANEKAGANYYSGGGKKSGTGKQTDSIANKKTGSIAEKKTGGIKGKKSNKQNEPKKELVFASVDDRPETGLLNENRAENASGGGETEALSETEDLNRTSVEETGELDIERPEPVPKQKRTGGVKLSMLDEVIIVHSDEVIS